MFEDYDQLIREMEREMRRLADQAFAGLVKLSEGPEQFWRPRVDVHETADHVLVVAEVAGMDRGNYRIEMAGDSSSLNIRGMRRETATDIKGRVRCHQLEIYYGAFQASVQLPDGEPLDREAISASYEDGLLRIVLPRLKSHRIEVQTEQS